MSHKLWKVTFTDSADKQFAKLNKSIKQQISNYIDNRIVPAEDPRTFGKPLTGNLATYWRYRIGDYRVVCQINDQQILITVVKVGHRKDIYE